jgi:hypothetical protein
MLIEPSPTPTSEALHAQQRVGWQPSRFLTDRAEAERPSSSPNSWAASTPPPKSWAPPGRRCARPSAGTVSACPPATPRPSASAPSPPPASATGGWPPRPWTRCLWPSTPTPCQLVNGHRPSCSNGSAATRSTPPWAPNVVVELNSESRARQPTTRAWAIIRRADRAHRLADQRTSRADRRHADRADRPSRSHQLQERHIVTDTR